MLSSETNAKTGKGCGLERISQICPWGLIWTSA
jgi:hypothetical protein